MTHIAASTRVESGIQLDVDTAIRGREGGPRVDDLLGPDDIRLDLNLPRKAPRHMRKRRAAIVVRHTDSLTGC